VCVVGSLCIFSLFVVCWLLVGYPLFEVSCVVYVCWLVVIYMFVLCLLFAGC
jgi:hypothetical protein